MEEFDSKRQEMASDATLRDYFAAKAMQAIGVTFNDNEHNFVANVAYKMADAMLKARG